MLAAGACKVVGNCRCSRAISHLTVMTVIAVPEALPPLLPPIAPPLFEGSSLMTLSVPLPPFLAPPPCICCHIQDVGSGQGPAVLTVRKQLNNIYFLSFVVISVWVPLLCRVIGPGQFLKIQFRTLLTVAQATFFDQPSSLPRFL